MRISDRKRCLLVFGLCLLPALPSCPSDPPSGNGALLARVDEIAPGADCAAGGSTIGLGADSDTNGSLDPGEVTSSLKICNGEVGRFALTRLTMETSGSNCPGGGVRIDT